MNLFGKAMKPVGRVLNDAKIKKDNINGIPGVQQLLKEYFDGKESSEGTNPEEVIAYGAAIKGGILSGAEGTTDVILVAASLLIFGVETTGGVLPSSPPITLPSPSRRARSSRPPLTANLPS